MIEFDNCLDRIDELQLSINQLRPLKKLELSQLKSFYNVGLTYTSNALEGNSLTETETKIVLEDGITIGGKPIRDHLEVLGHSDAFNKLYTILDKPISESIIKELHYLFYHRVDNALAGEYRRVKLIVSGSNYQFPHFDKVSSLMAQFVDAIDSHRNHSHPVVHAAYIHREFVSIHPFVDGNGRTARLLMNLSLLSNGYPVAIIPPIYRQHYIDVLKLVQLKGKTDPFDHFIMNMVLESQKEFIRHFS